MNSENEYLLSIVIPTRNRQKYALESIKQILSCTGKETQIVIQDNSDENILENETVILDNERIKYAYESKILSFVDNFEAGVRLSDGEYVTLLGDDDGVLSSIVEIANWAHENEVDAITSKINATYYWPHSGAKNYKCTEDTGYLRINSYDNTISSRDSIRTLKKVLHNGCQFYHSSGLPKIYHGLVKNEILKKIINKNGKLFSGLSPDIYSSFAIALTIDKVAVVDYPFTIDGNCPKSGAGAQAQGKHTGKLKDAPHFQGHNNYEWNKLVPEVYSVQTIWADSGLAALIDFGEKELLKEFNVEMLTAFTISNNKKIKEETFESYKKITGKGNIVAKISLFFAYLKGPLPNLAQRAFRRIIGLGQVGTIINNVSNIKQAEVEINKFNEKNTFIGGKYNVRI